MRLIDADAEISRIEKEIRRIDGKIERLKKLAAKEPFNAFHDFEKKLKQCYRNKVDCKAEIATLKNYQTAYNVDKVIERIKNCDYCDSDGYLESDAVVRIVKEEIKA